MDKPESVDHPKMEESHIEQTKPSESRAQQIISYDENGLAGIVRSPYVLGAAVLASMGGFSFGYGKK